MPSISGQSSYNFMSEESNAPRWTASNFNATALSKMPYVHMVEYAVDAGALEAGIRNWASKVAGGGQDAYRGLYAGKPTGGEYRFPYFADYHHVVGQNWQENTGLIGAAAKDIRNLTEQVAKAFLPSAGIVRPKSWEGQQEASYTFGFDLINTVTPTTDIKSNLNFLKQFITQNLYTQQNIMGQIPPCIYEVLIPGIRWSPAAIIGNIYVTNKGILSIIDDQDTTGVAGPMAIPDAWGVQIEVRELFNESSQIYEEVFLGSPTASGKGSKLTVKVF